LGKTVNAVSHHGAKQSTRLVTKFDETNLQTEQLLCWSGMTDTEQNTTSYSNEEDYRCIAGNYAFNR